MPHVVQFGAGAIGRGLLGQLWQEAGYETVFVDTDAALIDALNAQKSYQLRLVDNESEQTLTINNFRALHARDTEAVFDALRTCAFAAIAVGRSQLTPLIQYILGPGLKQRLRNQTQTPDYLTILLCENGLWDKEVSLLLSQIREVGGRRFYLVSTIVDRMVPPPTYEQVTTEPFGKLYLSWVRPEFPALPHVEQVQNWRIWANHQQTWPYLLNRKLFLHNGGHALVAFHGLHKGYTFISEALQDDEIAQELEQFWDEVTAALSRQHKIPRETDYEAELRVRLYNSALGDTCERVAREPRRKLGAHERLVRAGKLCLAQGVSTNTIARAIAVGLQHPEIAPLIAEKGIAQELQQLSGLSPTHALTKQVIAAAEALLPASTARY